MRGLLTYDCVYASACWEVGKRVCAFTHIGLGSIRAGFGYSAYGFSEVIWPVTRNSRRFHCMHARWEFELQKKRQGITEEGRDHARRGIQHHKPKGPQLEVEEVRANLCARQRVWDVVPSVALHALAHEVHFIAGEGWCVRRAWPVWTVPRARIFIYDER